MTKTRTGLLLKIIVAFLLCISMLVGCQNTSSVKKTYTIQVMSEGGKPLSDIKVYVYSDETKEDLIWAAEADEEGKVVFEAEQTDGYVAFLQEVPKGYLVEDSYDIVTEETEIRLKSVSADETDLASVTYKLGDIIHDFTVTSVNGTTYKLSELLKEKKAVVLNLWFMNCGPCKMEFPILQQAYDEYKDKIEVIAINPLDGTNSEILQYAQDNGLSFPMVKGDDNWTTWFHLDGYPTTIVIDRYSSIAMMHMGSITEKETFTKIFDYFTTEDYQQSIIRKVSDID